MAVRGLLCGAAMLVASAAAFGEAVSFGSPRDALKQGISAFSGGYYELAIPALEQAARGDEFLGNYYLARIYSDNTGARTNHAKAYDLYREIVNELADIDPDDDPRAPYVGRAMTALAGYMLRGLPEIGLTPNPVMAADLLENASSTFNDDDAQFELAKLQIKGEGVKEDIPKAKHWLATLSRKGHAGAQAFLAELLWRGRYMDMDQGRALALIAIAVANAPPQDRLWIEDIYQNIFCGAGEGIRKQATGIVAEWGDRYKTTRKAEADDRSGFGNLETGPVRTCQNGEPVGEIEGSNTARPNSADRYAGDRAFSRGSMTPGLREIGTEAPAGTTR